MVVVPKNLSWEAFNLQKLNAEKLNTTTFGNHNSTRGVLDTIVGHKV